MENESGREDLLRRLMAIAQRLEQDDLVEVVGLAELLEDEQLRAFAMQCRAKFAGTPKGGG